MAGKGLVGALTDLFAEAVTDIRHKVVEEGWFRRQVTGNDDATPGADAPAATGVTAPKIEQPVIEEPKIGPADDQLSFDADWAVRAPAAERGGHREQDFDFDR